MGLFAGACSIVRLVSLRNLYSVDITFQSSDTLDWSTIELGVGIFCASVPSFKPLLGGWGRIRESAAAKYQVKPSDNRTTVLQGSAGDGGRDFEVSFSFFEGGDRGIDFVGFLVACFAYDFVYVGWEV